MTTKNFYNTVYQKNHPSQYAGGDDGMPERTDELQTRTKEWLDLTGLSSISTAELLEIGCGMAFLSNIHSGWHGAEFSKTAVDRVKNRDGYNTRIFEEDAQSLSFKDASFDGVFTWAALEHVPDPNQACIEIDRVLKQEGYGLIAPAWNCRSWTVKKLEQRSNRELNWIEKIEKIFIPLREIIIVRAMLALPKRFLNELKLVVIRKPLRLQFKILDPRWDMIEKYGHVSDDDAVADIDPHAGICFFKSRDYKIISHPNFLARITARHKPLIVQKPKG